jgi:hypothetical protein
MKPIRSKERLAFIRSLPCCVSGRTDRVEAAHVGRRGMGQKSSDFETIPLNVLYHREQHRIGLRAFCRTYSLNLDELLTMLNEKPIIKQIAEIGRYAALYRDELLVLGLVSDGLPYSIKLLKDRVREILSDLILDRVRSFQSR